MKIKLYFAVIFLITTAIFSQEDIAVLIEGPKKNNGLEFLGPNALEYYSGIYTYNENRIEVFYTQEEIVPYRVWINKKCGSYKIKEFMFNDTKIYYYGRVTRYNLFIRISDELLDDCKFISKFISRLNYFYKVSLKTNEIPLPAVLNFKK